MKLKVAAIPLVALALIAGAPSGANAAPLRDRTDDFTKAESSGRVSTTYKPQTLDRDAKVNVMVQLSGDPVAVVQAKAGHRLSKKERAAAKAKITKAQKAVATGIKAKGGKVVNQLESAYNGIRVRIQRSKVTSLKSLPGVIAVHSLTPKKLDNTVSVPYIGTPQAWQSSGLTGAGVKVAIIDTGIDYTHADFGGPGTTEAYSAAKAGATTAADPALFGPGAPRIKGGYDFVGDDYDAATDGMGTPVPDPNPLDCGGHGSHVAGTAAGSGVTSDGRTFTGPYNAETPNVAFKVGPGVAPQADLYALKVFGCTGSTDVVVDAIDWAVDHNMDVINMSLGSSFGRSGDPDAVAASNAVAAGVVVVASSGNSGSNPYITGSPASGQGVLSVAAVDSTGTFPGAALNWGSTSVDAINANGADLPDGQFKIVVLADDPATSENEALGCSTQAFTKAGVDGSSPVIAVAKRGTCARVAKGIYGQQAGAKAVLMINNADAYPPYEGEVTSNPDDGTAFDLTIPFLGVPSSDAATLTAAAGQSLTMGPTTIDNPAFREVADFSSVGPVNGDSGLSPVVAAPGVSTSSVRVGSGTGAEVMSGTSMAAPHVAGVAALGVQAHPTWRADQVAAAVVGTADSEKVAAYGVNSAGAGLVDPVQVISTKTFVTGDSYRTKAGKVSEGTLSFGFAEPSSAFYGTKSFTITNTGSSAVTYTISNAAGSGSVPASVRFSTNRVRVPAHRSVTVKVALSVPAGTIGTSVGGADQFSLRQVSGNVVLTSSSGVLRVPYLLVPRAQAKVTGSITMPRPNPMGVPTPSATTSASLRLSNYGGALSAYADIYTLGLTDGADVSKKSGGSGYDLRAAGVQSFTSGNDSGLLVFAVNTHSRWSNAATDEFDVSIDTNKDGKTDWVVFSADSGAVRTGSFDGLTEVFVVDVAHGELFSSGYLAQAPTDSSTILLPVELADLGITADGDGFAYTVSSYTVEDPQAADEMNGWATYNPWNRAIIDGGGADVPRNQTVTVPVTIDSTKVIAQKPKGIMVAVLDNQSGAKEALLLGLR